MFLHVGTAFVEPTDGHTYDPTDGATTDPYPAVPACPWVATDDPSVLACAMAAVLKRAKAVANPIVVSFMVMALSCRLDQGQPHRPHDRSQPRHFLQVAIVSEIAIDFDEPAAQVFANDAGLNLKLETRRCGAFTVADHMGAAAADTVHSITSYSNAPPSGSFPSPPA